jgi:hypothetical protein
MEIPAATITQVRRTKDGGLMEITDDVCGIAQQLQEIDPHIHVRWSNAGLYFAVYWRHDGEREEGVGELILTTTELDGRVVERVRELGSPDYDYGAELDRIDAENEKAKQHAINEKLGEAAEETYFELRKATGKTNRAYVPERPK